MQRKEKKLVYKEKEESKSDRSSFIINEETVETLVKSLACPSCFGQDVNAKFLHHQLDTYVKVLCSKCDKVCCDTQPSVKIKRKNFHTVTLILIYVTMLVGVGYVGVNKLGSLLNFRNFRLETFTLC